MMWYVYILKSKNEDWTYVGYTSRLKSRLKEHNEGRSRATKPYAPFELKSYLAVKTEAVAKKLEKYLKTGSGRAWFKKRLLNE